MTVVEGDGICLREFCESDLEDMCAWINDIPTTMYMGSAYRRAMTYDMVRDRLDILIENESGAEIYVISDAGGAYIGEAALCPIDRLSACGEAALMITPKYRCKGFGSKALGLILEYGFGELGLKRIWLKVAADNVPAIRLYEKHGFEREGVLRKHEYINGKYCDLIIMAVLREEYGV